MGNARPLRLLRVVSLKTPRPPCSTNPGTLPSPMWTAPVPVKPFRVALSPSLMSKMAESQISMVIYGPLWGWVHKSIPVQLAHAYFWLHPMPSCVAQDERSPVLRGPESGIKS